MAFEHAAGVKPGQVWRRLLLTPPFAAACVMVWQHGRQLAGSRVLCELCLCYPHAVLMLCSCCAPALVPGYMGARAFIAVFGQECAVLMGTGHAPIPFDVCERSQLLKWCDTSRLQ